MPTPYRQQTAQPILANGFLLFLLPLPMLSGIVTALSTGAAFSALMGLTSFGLFMLSAYLVRRGLHYQAIQKKRKWARSTRIPWKTMGALLAGIATVICIKFLTIHGWFTGLGYGVGATIGVFLAYGFDPQHSGEDVVSKFGVTADEVIDLLEEAESNIADIEISNRDIRNPELNGRLRRITAKARDILKVIEEDPRDARRARKFLKVYLDGAKKVTQGYARAHKMQQNETLDTNFRNVLTTIEEVVEEQKTKLLENDVWDLDVQIEVLETQLKREGVI